MFVRKEFFWTNLFWFEYSYEDSDEELFQSSLSLHGNLLRISYLSISFNYLNLLNDIITYLTEILIAMGHNAENYLLNHADLQNLKAICSLSLDYLSVTSDFPHISLNHVWSCDYMKEIRLWKQWNVQSIILISYFCTPKKTYEKLSSWYYTEDFGFIH